MANHSSEATYSNFEIIAWLAPEQSNSLTFLRSLSTQTGGNGSNGFASNGIAASHQLNCPQIGILTVLCVCYAQKSPDVPFSR